MTVLQDLWQFSNNQLDPRWVAIGVQVTNVEAGSYWFNTGVKDSLKPQGSEFANMASAWLYRANQALKAAPKDSYAPEVEDAVTRNANRVQRLVKLGINVNDSQVRTFLEALPGAIADEVKSKIVDPFAALLKALPWIIGGFALYLLSKHFSKR